MMFFDMDAWSFGQGEGCAGVAPDPCQTLELRNRVRGPVVDAASGARLGALDFVMTETLTLRDGDTWAPLVIVSRQCRADRC